MHAVVEIKEFFNIKHGGESLSGVQAQWKGTQYGILLFH
jgi:hypothetical protein